MKKIIMIVAMLAGFTATTFAAGRGETGARQYELHQKIAKERCHGKISRKQARFMNAERKSIGREIHADRRAHGGHLNRAEKYAINQHQNQLSRQVYSAKR